MKFADELMQTADDIFKGKTHGGNAKEATVGEVLEKLGLSEAEIDSFVKKYNYDSPDQSLYDHYIKMKPGHKKYSVAETMTDVRTYLESCMQKEAEAAADRIIDSELSPDEKERLAFWKARKKRIDSGGAKIDKIKSWVDEKGKFISQDLSKTHTATKMLKCRLLTEGGRPLTDISPNTFSQTVLNRQAEENAYIAQIIRGEKTAEQAIEDVIREGNEKLPGLERGSKGRFLLETLLNR